MSRVVTILQKAQRLVTDNSPAILTAVAVAGVVSTSILAAKASPNAVRDIQDAESERIDPLTPVEKVKLTWTYFIPAAAAGSVTIACIIGANTVSSKRQAALMSAYTLSERVFHEYRDKVEETIGVEKNERIRDDIAQDRITNNPVSSNQVILTGNGEVLCQDSYTGKYFRSSMQALKKAQNDLNAQIINDMYASQNEFHAMLGIPPCKYGDEFGWNTNKLLELDIRGGMSEDEEPCLVVDYNVEPNRGYHKFG